MSRNREHCTVLLGEGDCARSVMKIVARRGKDIVVAMSMSHPTNFHTTRKRTYIHGTTWNGPPHLRDYWRYERMPFDEIEHIELLKLIEVSPLASEEDALGELEESNERRIPIVGGMRTNSHVYVFLGEARAVAAAALEAEAPPRLTARAVELAGFMLLIVVEALPRVGGPALCCKTDWYCATHAGNGVGPPYIATMLT